MKPRLRVPALGLVSGRYELDVESSRYAIKVHRVRTGDELWLFDPESGLHGLGTVLEAQRGTVVLEVPKIEAALSQALPVTLLWALGKGDKPEQAIVDATVLGARRVVLLETERTIVRGGGDRARRHHKMAIEAARQSGRSDLPVLEGPLSLEQALLREDSAHKLVFAWHAECQPLLRRLSAWQPTAALALLIGPEGGLSPDEVELARAHGFLPTSLGPLVLRTETAVTVALGVVRARSEI